MLSTVTRYSYNDVAIVPAEMSEISSRKEINIDYLPIFTAPMTSVVNIQNIKDFYLNDITPIIPRSENIKNRMHYVKEGFWIAVSLQEFENYFIVNTPEPKSYFKVCIDIANGHMQKLYDLCIEAKEKAIRNGYTLIIMTGNIANYKTYSRILEMRDSKNLPVIDYIRVGIGGGNGCITSSNTGIHYPMASLINDCKKTKSIYQEEYPYNYCTSIVADGGIRNYSDVIKALALGADYVMIGSLFAQCEESAAEKVEILGKKHAVFYGMASADGQKALCGEKTKTAEGITKQLPVLYTIKQWSENMVDYLKSAMSYCNCKTLEEFINEANVIVISNNTVNSVNK